MSRTRCGPDREFLHQITNHMILKEHWRFIGSTLSWAVRVGCAQHLVHEYVYECTETRGESMLPTVHSINDYVHVLKRYRFGRDVEIGDCIVAVKPSDPGHRVCKRITGMPGDVILVDPSSSSPLTNSPAQILENDGFNHYITVPDGHVWCTGDNLCHSLDSRSYSVLPMGLITGKVVAVHSMKNGIWSLFDWNLFKWIENSFKQETT